MNKTLVIDLSKLELEGDILDVAKEKIGIIYDISKEIEMEISVDYIEEESKYLLKERRYDVCTMFFNLNNLFFYREREKLLKDISKYLKDDGKIYIWDINKQKMQTINNKVNIITTSRRIKEGRIINKNLFSTCNYAEILKIMKKYYIIEEAKTWEDMFFIEGRMEKKHEGITYST